MQRAWWIVVIALALLHAAKAGRPISKIKVDGLKHWFLDDHGRVRLFHGVNAVRKEYPWFPDYFMDNKHIQNLADVGMNVVRLGVMWSGVEPQEGVYNQTYIDIIQDMIERLADHGIYTMLDMHQDVMSERYTAYDGIPRWLVDKYPESPNPFPWPLEEISSWEMKYFSQAVSQAFQHFYDNYEGSIDKWGDFWAKVTKSYKDIDGMLGYNLINEPWVGDYLKNGKLLYPGIAGQKNLMPNYHYLNQRIREHDPNGIIFYEPILYGQLYHDMKNGSGFDTVPGGPEYINVSAYSYHTYCWHLEFLEGNADDNARKEAIEKCKTQLLPQKFKAQSDNVVATGGAAILTEFGLCKPSAAARLDIPCNVFMDLADKALQSWVDWDHSDMAWFLSNRDLNLDKAFDYARAYAEAVAGEPISMVFNPDTADFDLKFEADANISEPTVIIVPQMRYYNGFFVQLSNGLQWKRDGNRVLVTIKDRENLEEVSHVHISHVY